jgi:multidrug efflux pump subunit AcrA (membrane-fusion protein)
VDGVITQRNLSPGVLVGPGQSILKVAQVRPIRVQANVPEVDLARIRRGSRVRIRSQQSAGGSTAPEWTGSVSAIFPAVDPSARTGIVEALLPNVNGRILPGQFVTMEITVAEQPGALRVPSTAVHWRTGPSPFGQTGQQQAYVWLAEPTAQAGATTYYCPMHLEVRSPTPGRCPKCKMDLVPEQVGGKWKARRAEVSVGASDGRFTAVASGLKEGDHVVASGYQGLRDGDALSPTNEKELHAPLGGAAAGGKGKYWCPMHPEVTSDDPSATCARCNGMKLLPRPAGK